MDMTRDSILLGRRIKKARMDKDITQVELANMLGIKCQSVANYERGARVPNIETLKKIAIYTDTPLSKLVKGFPEQSENTSVGRVKHLERRDAVSVLTKIMDSAELSEELQQDLIDIQYCVVTNEWGKKKVVF